MTSLMATSTMWLIAFLWPPVVIALSLLVWAIASHLRRFTRKGRSKASIRSRTGARPSLPQPTPLQKPITAAKKPIPAAKKPIAAAPSACSHDFELRVMGAAEEVAVVVLDRRSSGHELLRRARCCLGEGLADLALPSGEDLELAVPLWVQGLEGGETLRARRAVPRKPEARQRPRVEIIQYSIKEYTSKVSEHLDSFGLVVSAAQEPDAISEATEDTVRVDFEEDGLMLKIRGRKVDYVLRRHAGRTGAARGSQLPVGFSICPPRCTMLVVPHKKVELTLRPFPPKWLDIGLRVQIQGLKDSPELNGRMGTVTGFVECQGEEKEALQERYCLKLDEGKVMKKIKRCNLALLPAKPPDAADAAAGTSPSPGLQRNTGLEAKRLLPLEDLP